MEQGGITEAGSKAQKPELELINVWSGKFEVAMVQEEFPYRAEINFFADDIIAENIGEGAIGEKPVMYWQCKNVPVRYKSMVKLVNDPGEEPTIVDCKAIATVYLLLYPGAKHLSLMMTGVNNWTFVGGNDHNVVFSDILIELLDEPKDFIVSGTQPYDYKYGEQHLGKAKIRYNFTGSFGGCPAWLKKRFAASGKRMEHIHARTSELFEKISPIGNNSDVVRWLFDVFGLCGALSAGTLAGITATALAVAVGFNEYTEFFRNTPYEQEIKLLARELSEINEYIHKVMTLYPDCNKR